MKAFAITLALAGVATAAPMSAQVVARTVPVTNRPACVYTRTTNSVGDIILAALATSIAEMSAAVKRVDGIRLAAVLITTRFTSAAFATPTEIW